MAATVIQIARRQTGSRISADARRARLYRLIYPISAVVQIRAQLGTEPSDTNYALTDCWHVRLCSPEAVRAFRRYMDAAMQTLNGAVIEEGGALGSAAE